VSDITFGSLFAGIGGFDLGFERSGMVCKWQVEIDDYATKVLEKHWPRVHRERDIRQCGATNLERVDVICGGFPCQDISYAGLGAGLDGERSGLFFEAIRVVRELRPRVVVLENVAALLTRGLDRVLGTLAEIGYDAEWHCIPAASIGAPHIRDRVFIISYADSITSSKANSESVSKSLEQNSRMGSARRSWLSKSKSDWWATEPAICRMANGVPSRVDRLRGLGNAVVPQVAELIGRHVVENLKEQKQ
jgi:DNA (cytosine-5)-methyltransferase 1